MNAKITVPSNVATAIAHYVNLADTKTEALTDILSMGYEAEKSEIILRHFDGNHDELMQALICGYEVEKSPGEKVLDYYEGLKDAEDNCELNGHSGSQFRQGWQSVEETLNLLGIQIFGVNA
jgi:DNA integrity scanning protein DisA with diadenylate cyclase activity